MKTAYLSLGSNIGDRERNLAEALERMAQAGIQVVGRSSLYETQPRDVLDQPWFLNQVVEVETGLLPQQLLDRLLAIERAQGRKRPLPKGPRSIDLDILLYGTAVIATAGLQIPHPRLAERRFALEPLAELAPLLRHPVSGQPIRDLLAGVADQTVRKWRDPKKRPDAGRASG